MTPRLSVFLLGLLVIGCSGPTRTRETTRNLAVVGHLYPDKRVFPWMHGWWIRVGDGMFPVGDETGPPLDPQEFVDWRRGIEERLRGMGDAMAEIHGGPLPDPSRFSEERASTQYEYGRWLGTRFGELEGAE